MKGICRACGKIAELHSCRICGSVVCGDCLIPLGCKICKGRKII